MTVEFRQYSRDDLRLCLRVDQDSFGRMTSKPEIEVLPSSDSFNGLS